MTMEDLAKACKDEYDIQARDRMMVVRSVRIKMKECGMNKTKACRITAQEFQMCETSVRNHIRNYEKFGIKGLYDSPKCGGPTLYPPEIVAEAMDELEAEGRLNARNLGKRVQKKRSDLPRMSQGHARRLMKARNKSRKKAQPVNVAAAKPHKVYYWRAVCLPIILALRTLGYTVMVGDEMIVDEDASASAGYWSEIGVPVKVPYVGDHGKFGALGLITEPDKKGRVRRCSMTADSINTASFTKLLEAAYRRFGRIVVIVDRAGWHNSKELKNYLATKKGRVLVILLPVGSSYMNATEEDWHQTKLADFYQDYYTTIKKKEEATIEYISTELNPRLDLWKYLIRSPYAYRRRIRRRKNRYGLRGALQYIIDRYEDPEIAQNPFLLIEKFAKSGYVLKI